MLIELAIGDAYGAGFEYVSAKIVREKNDLSGYRQHPRHLIVPGAYTDDTQMTISIAEVIISGDAWTKLNLTKSFVRCFKRDPREGYASGFYRFLEEVKDGSDFLNKIKPDSEKSGAAMRASPVGLFPDLKEVVERTTVQASITHGTKFVYQFGSGCISSCTLLCL